MSESEKIRQPYRVVVGHCPKCERVLVVENSYEVWPLVVCKCGWEGATTAIDHAARYEHDGVVKDHA
jgi:hypothetical protein